MKVVFADRDDWIQPEELVIRTINYIINFSDRARDNWDFILSGYGDHPRDNFYVVQMKQDDLRDDQGYRIRLYFERDSEGKFVKFYKREQDARPTVCQRCKTRQGLSLVNSVSEKDYFMVCVKCRRESETYFIGHVSWGYSMFGPRALSLPSEDKRQ